MSDSSLCRSPVEYFRFGSLAMQIEDSPKVAPMGLILWVSIGTLKVMRIFVMCYHQFWSREGCCTSYPHSSSPHRLSLKGINQIIDF